VLKTDDLRKRLRGAKAELAGGAEQAVRQGRARVRLRRLDAKALTGPSAMVYGKGDVVAAAKVLKDFIKENEKPVIKIGALQGQLLSRTDVESLAALPSREILLGQAVGTIAAPMSQLVGVLQQKVASVVYVLQAYTDKKGKAAWAATIKEAKE
jgi:large subunit ribosomal protein L10